MAFDRAAEYEARHFGYVTAILDNAIARCVYTPEEYDEITGERLPQPSAAPTRTLAEIRASLNKRLEEELSKKAAND